MSRVNDTVRALVEAVALVERENRELTSEAKKLAAQLDDACDGIHELRERLKVADQIIEELRAIQVRR